MLGKCRERGLSEDVGANQAYSGLGPRQKVAEPQPRGGEMSDKDLIPTQNDEESAEYQRLKAPVIFRHAPLFSDTILNPETLNTTFCMYSDEPVEKGWKLTLEILLPDQEPVHCHGQVTWVGKLPQDAQARYDVGIRLLDLQKEQRRALERFLESR